MKNTARFKKLIEDELETVTKELRSVGRVNPTNPEDWEPLPAEKEVDPADTQEVATSIEEYEDNAAILKQLEIRYHELRAALLQIESGTYGVCSVCGKMIEDGRLGANPGATTCVEHK